MQELWGGPDFDEEQVERAGGREGGREGRRKAGRNGTPVSWEGRRQGGSKGGGREEGREGGKTTFEEVDLIRLTSTIFTPSLPPSLPSSSLRCVSIPQTPEEIEAKKKARKPVIPGAGRGGGGGEEEE